MTIPAKIDSRLNMAFQYDVDCQDVFDNWVSTYGYGLINGFGYVADAKAGLLDG